MLQLCCLCAGCVCMRVEGGGEAAVLRYFAPAIHPNGWDSPVLDGKWEFVQFCSYVRKYKQESSQNLEEYLLHRHITAAKLLITFDMLSWSCPSNGVISAFSGGFPFPKQSTNIQEQACNLTLTLFNPICRWVRKDHLQSLSQHIPALLTSI